MSDIPHSESINPWTTLSTREGDANPWIRVREDQVINPSKEINEQFVPIVITTKDEELITGVIVNLGGDGVTVNTDLADPYQRVNVDRKNVVSIAPSKISPMPTGLLNQLTKDEILDLAAYVLSGGNPEHELFRKSP